MDRIDRTVSSLAALRLLYVAELDEGTSAWVEAEATYYTLEKASGVATDGVNIVAPAAGAPIAGAADARWLREASLASVWAAQPAWYIDPLTGSDNNPGTLSAPLRTHARLEQVFAAFPSVAGRPFINRLVDVHCLGDMPEVLRVVAYFGPLGGLRYHGMLTTLYTSGAGFTARVVLDAAAQTPPAVTDAALGVTTWTSFMNQFARIRTTGGSHPGAVAWPIKDLGGGAARVSPWCVLPDALQPPPFALLQAEVDVSVNDPFVVEKLSKALVDVDIVGAWDTTEQTLGIRLTFDGFDMEGTTTTANIVRSDGIAALAFYGCNVDTVDVVRGALNAFQSCRSSISRSLSGANALFASCWIHGTVSVLYGAGARFLGDCIAQGTPIADVKRNGWVEIVSAAAFDSGSDGIDVEADGMAKFTGLFWGANNAGYGVRSGGHSTYVTKPTCAGNTNAALVGGTPKASGDIPYLEPVNGATLVVFA